MYIFQCLTLSNKYKRGKLLAYQLLCQMMVRHADVTIPQDLLAQFYHVLHQGLSSQDQVCILCILVPRIFTVLIV